MRKMWLKRSKPWRGYAGSAGMTLIELIVIVAIFGIILVITLPNLVKQLPRIRLEGARDQTITLMQHTRLEAIKKNRPFTIEATAEALTGVGTVSFQELNVQYWTDALCYVGYSSPPITFDGTGKADGKKALCITDERGNVFQIAIDSIQGTPKVRKYLDAADSPTGASGFFLSKWKWY